MLPSFRLIAATFLCGFVVVFAGLRLATSLHAFHVALPVMAAHAAPAPITPIADRDMRRGQTAVPVLYDLRFAVSTTAHAPNLDSMTSPIIDRAAPVETPQISATIVDEGAAKAHTAAQSVSEPAPAKPPSAMLASINPEAPVADPVAAPKAATAPVEPMLPEPPAPAAVDLRFTPPLKVAAVQPTETPRAATIEETAAIEPPETPPREAALSPEATPIPEAAPAAEATPAVKSAPAVEAEPAPEIKPAPGAAVVEPPAATTAAVTTPDLEQSLSPAISGRIPLPQAKASPQAQPAPRANAAVKRPTRSARRAVEQDPFANFGNPFGPN